jgi:hypothetical protein
MIMIYDIEYRTQQWKLYYLYNKQHNYEYKTLQQLTIPM